MVWNAEVVKGSLLFVCVLQCQGIALQPNCSSAVHRLPACLQPRARQLSLGSQGHCCTPLHPWPQACIESRPLLWWHQNLSLFCLGSSPAILPAYNSHGSPWLVIALIGSNLSLFKTSVLLGPRLAVFLLKSWFYSIFTCGIPTEIDMDKSALSSCSSDSAWSTAKYRKRISTDEMVSFFFF